MQTCDNFDPTKIIGIGHLNHRYTLLDYLGEGSFGKVYKVVDKGTDRVVVMKLVALQSDEDITSEVVNGCLLTSLTTSTSSVIQIINIAIVDIYPVFGGFSRKLVPYTSPEVSPDELVSLEGIDFRLPRQRYISGLMITLPLLEGPLQELGLDRHEALGALFELLVVLVLLRSLNLAHKDIYEPNVLYQEVDYDRLYTINGTRYMVRSPYLPVLIDFGKSIRNPTEYKDDWRDLFFYFRRNVGHVEGLEGIRDGERSVLLSHHFDHLKEIQLEGGDSVKVFSPLTL